MIYTQFDFILYIINYFSHFLDPKDGFNTLVKSDAALEKKVDNFPKRKPVDYTQSLIDPPRELFFEDTAPYSENVFVPPKEVFSEVPGPEVPLAIVGLAELRMIGRRRMVPKGTWFDQKTERICDCLSWHLIEGEDRYNMFKYEL